MVVKRYVGSTGGRTRKRTEGLEGAGGKIQRLQQCYSRGALRPPEQHNALAGPGLGRVPVPSRPPVTAWMKWGADHRRLLHRHDPHRFSFVVRILGAICLVMIWLFANVESSPVQFALHMHGHPAAHK